MREVGVDTDAALLRRLPLALHVPRRPRPAAARRRAGAGLRARGAAPARLALARPAGAAGCRRALGGMRAFAATDALTVAELARGLPAPCARDLIEPLCVAALNTPAGAGQRRGVPARAARCAVQRPGLVRSAAARARRSARCCRSRPLRWLRAPWRARCARRARVVELQPHGRAAGRSTASAFDARRAGLQRRRSRAAVRSDRARMGRTRPPRCATSRSSRCTCSCAGARLRAPMLALHADADGAGAVRLRPGRARRPGRACSPSSSAARALGRSQGWRRRRGHVGAGAGGLRARHLAAAADGCCTWPPRSAPPFAARRACSGRRRRSPPACGPPAITSPGPTRPRWKARCAPGGDAAAARCRVISAAQRARPAARR